MAKKKYKRTNNDLQKIHIHANNGRNKMTHKTKSVGTVPKSNRKIIERGKIDTPKKYT
jgi:hypothetical protein